MLAEGAICPWLEEEPPVRKPSRGTEITPNSKCDAQGKEVRNTGPKSVSVILVGIMNALL